jgi:hypothetical protein
MFPRSAGSGGAVRIRFQIVIPYQRFWDDVCAQVREWYGQGLRLRQAKAELDAQLATSVGLRKLNEEVLAIAHLAPQAVQERGAIPPVVRVDRVWVKLMEPTGKERPDRLGSCRLAIDPASSPGYPGARF